eukprot:gene32230-16793_t
MLHTVRFLRNRLSPRALESHLRLLSSASATGGASQGEESSGQRWLAVSAVGVGAAVSLGLSVGASPASADANSIKKENKEAVYSKDEVAKHRTPATGIWVIYKGDVFDITEFVAKHPGGAQKIMMAAGGSVEPFWAMYQQHKKAEVREMLAQYRIGKLEGWSAASAPVMADPYINAPRVNVLGGRLW